MRPFEPTIANEGLAFCTFLTRKSNEQLNGSCISMNSALDVTFGLCCLLLLYGEQPSYGCTLTSRKRLFESASSLLLGLFSLTGFFSAQILNSSPDASFLTFRTTTLEFVGFIWKQQTTSRKTIRISGGDLLINE